MAGNPAPDMCVVINPASQHREVVDNNHLVRSQDFVVRHSLPLNGKH